MVMVTELTSSTESLYSPQSVYAPTALPTVGAAFASPTLKPSNPITIHNSANQVYTMTFSSPILAVRRSRF